MHRFIGAVAAVLLLAAGCSSKPGADARLASGGAAPPESSAPSGAGPDAASADGALAPGSRPAPSGSNTPAASSGAGSVGSADPGAPGEAPPGWTPGPVLGGAQEAPPEPDENGRYDDFDRWADPPPGAVRVAGKTQTGDVEWALYAFRQGDNPCLHFAVRGPATGSVGGGCKEPPLGVSTSRSENGRFGFGLTSPEVAKVRFEHVDGATETFDTVTGKGYSERFFAGELAETPLTRVVALNSEGKVVAERTDMTAHNM